MIIDSYNPSGGDVEPVQLVLGNLVQQERIGEKGYKHTDFKIGDKVCHDLPNSITLVLIVASRWW